MVNMEEIAEKLKANRKKIGLVLSVVGIIILLLHTLLAFPLCDIPLNGVALCTYCVYTWYLVGGGMLIGGLYLYFVEPKPKTNNNNNK